MVGTLDSQVIEKFNEFKKQTNQYNDLKIEKVLFNKKLLKNLHQVDKVTTQINTTADKFIEIGDIDRETKKYDISNKIKPNLPQKGKHAPKNTILVSRVRPLLGGYTIIDGDDYTFTSGDLNPIVLPDSIDVNYVFKIICSPKFRTYLKNNQNTSGQKPTITKKLYDFDIPIPKNYAQFKSIDIQNIIVEFLEYWKINYTDVFRTKIVRQKPVIEKIKHALIPATLKYDKTIENSFNEFSISKNFNVKLKDIDFKNISIFNDKKYFETDTPILGYAQKDLTYKEDGYDIYSGKVKPISKGVYVEKQLIHANKDNIKISFATDGDASAGANFVIHDKPFYVNATRMVLSFKENSFYSYFYLQMLNMKEKYKFDYGKKANMTNLPEVKIHLPFSSNIDSKDLQVFLVEFWNRILNDIDNKFEKFENISKLTDKIDEAFLYRTFSKIKWSE